MVAQVHSEQLTGPIEISKGNVRVLQIVENLDSQAVESWLVRVLRASHEDYPQVHWTFFCVLGREGRLDDLARSLGAEVIYSKHEIGDKLRFIRSLRDVMKRGHYDILHCHHDVMSAAYLLASRGLPFQKRIVHIHNTSLSLPTPNRLKANLVREPMRQMCLRMADQVVGISKDALDSMIGELEYDPIRHRVVHYAVDTARFEKVSTVSQKLRADLGLLPNTKVLLFVGRMVDYKNPCFVVNLLEYLVQLVPHAVAVFAGTGDQENEVQKLANQKSLEDRIRLLGFRQDVPELMLASNLLVWPSLEEPKEGLGLGIIEAQAAGLPILMSRSVPEEAIVIPELVDVLPLTAGPDVWAQTARNILERQPLPRRECLAKLELSSFSMDAGVSNLMGLYELGERK